MVNENNFETFLYYTDKKLSISVRQVHKNAKFYERCIILDENQDSFKMNRQGLISYGKSLKPQITDENVLYREGLNNFAIDPKSLKTLLDKNRNFKENTIRVQEGKLEETIRANKADEEIKREKIVKTEKAKK